MTELERVAEQYANDNSLVDEVPIPQVYEDAFKAGAEWQKKQLIEKACKWLKEKTPFFTDRLIYLFRKAMED